MTIYEQNTGKIKELLPNIQWAFARWMDDCFAQGKQFEIREAYRTQQRQAELYKIGRRGIVGEKPVTWTLASLHTKRLALDVYPINCTHGDIAPLAEKYGIEHPWPTDDPPHYQVPDTRTVLMAMYDYYKRVLPRLSPLRLKMVQRLLGRLQTILGLSQ